MRQRGVGRETQRAMSYGTSRGEPAVEDEPWGTNGSLGMFGYYGPIGVNANIESVTRSGSGVTMRPSTATRPSLSTTVMPA